MQRPCFALAVLLGSLTSSVLVVSKVNSQSLAMAVIELPGPASISGSVVEASAISVVLGQSIDTEDDGWWDHTGGADQVASDDGQQRDADSSLATAENIDWSTNLWWTLLTAGYDKAQDLVVCGGHCFAVASYQTESEQSPSVDPVIAEPGDVSYLTSGPTNLLSCEDYEYCLEDVVGEPILLPEDCAVWLWHGIEDARIWAGDQLQGWWTIACDQAAQLRERVAQTIAEPSANELRDDVGPATTFSTNAAADFQEEVLLIAAADSLDHLSWRLQEAAWHLRYWAADRIVAKGSSRRVANKPAH